MLKLHFRLMLEMKVSRMHCESVNRRRSELIFIAFCVNLALSKIIEYFFREEDLEMGYGLRITELRFMSSDSSRCWIK